MTVDVDGPVILFDGVCNLCNASVLFVLAHEDGARFRFASLQSTLGQELVRRHRVIADSIVLVEGGRAWVRSGAAVRVALGLRWPWRALAAFWIVPAPLRDLGYAVVARLRYRVFGKRDACMVPTPALRARFLDAPAST